MSKKIKNKKEPIKTVNIKGQKIDSKLEESVFINKEETENDDAKFSRRKILNNWSKYEEEIIDDIAEASSSKNFSTALQTSSIVNPIYQYKNYLDDNMSTTSQEFNKGTHLTLDLNYLSILLDCIPLHQRLDLPQDIFDNDQILSFYNEAKASEILLNSKKESDLSKNGESLCSFKYNDSPSPANNYLNNLPDSINEKSYANLPLTNIEPPLHKPETDSNLDSKELVESAKTYFADKHKKNNSVHDFTIVKDNIILADAANTDPVLLTYKDESIGIGKDYVVKLNEISSSKKVDIKNEKCVSIEELPDIEALEAELESFLKL